MQCFLKRHESFSRARVPCFSFSDSGNADGVTERKCALSKEDREEAEYRTREPRPYVCEEKEEEVTERVKGKSTCLRSLLCCSCSWNILEYLSSSEATIFLPSNEGLF